MQLEMLESVRYQRLISTLDTKPTVRVHRALIKWPDGVIRDSHLKIPLAQPGLPCRHLINEAVGWLLARACGLPVPPVAGYMLLEAEQLLDAHPDLDKHAASGGALAWVCSTEPATVLRLTRSEAEQLVLDEIREWAHAPGTAALDEWIANADRHAGNLLRRAPKDFVLIDHDNALTGAHWLDDWLEMLSSNDFDNLLIRHIEASICRSSDAFKAIANGMLYRSEAFPAALSETLDEVRHWVDMLVDTPEGQWSAAAFLKYRSENIGPSIRRRYDLLT